MPSVKQILRNFWKRYSRQDQVYIKKSNLARVEKLKPKWATVGNGGCGRRWDKLHWAWGGKPNPEMTVLRAEAGPETVMMINCNLNKEMRKRISGSAVKFSICRATLFPLPQLRTVHPAYCPISATHPDRKPTRIIPSISSPFCPDSTPSLCPSGDKQRSLCALPGHAYVRIYTYTHRHTCMITHTHTHTPRWWHKYESPCLSNSMCLSQMVEATGPQLCRLETQHTAHSSP